MKVQYIMIIFCRSVCPIPVLCQKGWN